MLELLADRDLQFGRLRLGQLARPAVRAGPRLLVGCSQTEIAFDFQAERFVWLLSAIRLCALFSFDSLGRRCLSDPLSCFEFERLLDGEPAALVLL